MSDTGIGFAVKRKEDKRFLTGKGNYTDDINRPGQTYAYLVRSPHAHATINSVDIAAAKTAPGVVGVFVGQDLLDDAVGGLICGASITGKGGEVNKVPPRNVLTMDKGTSKLAQSSTAQTALVQIERYEGPVPEITVFAPPVTSRAT